MPHYIKYLTTDLTESTASSLKTKGECNPLTSNKWLRTNPFNPLSEQIKSRTRTNPFNPLSEQIKSRTRTNLFNQLNLWFLIILMWFPIILIMCMPHVAVAQVPIPDVPGIRLGENRLDFPGSRERFDSLLCCLHDSNAHLNILHIGGSHVQAGTFPHRLRENIGAARGMLFPWKTIRSNAPADYSLTSSGSWEKSRCLEPSPTEQLVGRGIMPRQESTSTQDSWLRSDARHRCS